MNADQEGFLARLADDEDDEMTRLVYSDWLEEHGQVEEAERQRAWIGGKAWIVRLCDDHGRGDRDDDYGSMSYHELMVEARMAVADQGRRSPGINFGAAEGLQDAIRENAVQFWRNFSIVTGIPVPDDFRDKCYYSCSC